MSESGEGRRLSIIARGMAPVLNNGRVWVRVAPARWPTHWRTRGGDAWGWIHVTGTTGVGAASAHIAMYGVTGLSADDLAKYETSGKGTRRFPVGGRPPLALIRRIVQARIARNTAKR
jgi:hypothetical protein